MTAPDAPFPKTAASSPAEFKAAYEAAFEARGRGGRVDPRRRDPVGDAQERAQVARDMLPDREIHLVDSQGASMAQGILARMGVEMAADGRSAEDIAETLSERAQRHHHLPDPRHPRLPQEGRPDQRGPGGDRDAPVGQADHRGQGRRGRDGRSGADPWQGPRPHGRAGDCSGRSSGCRSCTRCRPTSRPSARRCWRGSRTSIRTTSRSRSSGRRSGRTSARAASASCCCTSRAASLTARCIAARLRQPCRPVPSGRRPRRTAAILWPAHESRVAPSASRTLAVRSASLRQRGAPWGRPGDDPHRRGDHGTVARHGGLSFHDHGTRRCAHQRVGSRPAAVRPRGRSPRPRSGHAPRPARATARVHRPLPGPHGRRLGQGLHRLPRPAQPRPRPGQGRHPLPPGRLARRGQGPRDVDDLEVRGRRHPVRRRQGRRHRRSQEAEP